MNEGIRTNVSYLSDRLIPSFRDMVTDDYERVLLGGLWVVYESYLTVQMCSCEFSTSEDYPKMILVWVLFLGLPYRYYSKNLFNAIASLIGTGIRVDFNTTEGRWGKFTRLTIAVELDKPLIPSLIVGGHLQSIGYKADIYGPWMQVERRKHKPSMPSRTTTIQIGDTKMNGGSHFNVLDGVDDIGQQSHMSTKQHTCTSNNQDIRPLAVSDTGTSQKLAMKVIPSDKTEHVVDRMESVQPPGESQQVDAMNSKKGDTIVKPTNRIDTKHQQCIHEGK
ncbi:hypothetical protein V6N13_082614 [Hibiscus sabdariffa]